MNNKAQIDGFPVAQLPSRYGVAQPLRGSHSCKRQKAKVLPPFALCPLPFAFELARVGLLSTSDLSALLKLSPRTINRQQSFERYGFTFTRAGRNGTEIAWFVNKSGS